MKYMLESTIKTLGPCTNEGAKNFQNLLVWPFLGSFGRFWAFLAITWDLQMLESWFWCQTSCFGMNFFKKISKFFFLGPKKSFFGLGGPFWVP